MTDNTTTLVRCPDCDTSVEKPDMEAAIETVEKHNETRHDGEQVAGIGPSAMPVPSFSEEEAEQIRTGVEALKDE
jgi:hypothetical protein